MYFKLLNIISLVKQNSDTSPHSALRTDTLIIVVKFYKTYGTIQKITHSRYNEKRISS